MLKTLFGQKYTKAFIDRVAWRKAQYYENRRLKTIRENATKMAYNWSHEYPTGTPIEYIRDDIIEMWERAEKVGIFSNLEKEQLIDYFTAHVFDQYERERANNQIFADNKLDQNQAIDQATKYEKGSL